MIFSKAQALQYELEQNEKTIRMLLVVFEAAADLIHEPRNGFDRALQEARLEAAIQAFLGLR